MVQDPDNQDVLKAEHLFCERDNRILFEDLNFAAHRGQVIQIKGSNGSGKTTLLRILCGLNEGFRGSLTWFNKPIQDHWEEVHSSLIYMGHRVGVNKILTPVENLRWSVGLSTSVTDEQINEIITADIDDPTKHSLNYDVKREIDVGEGIFREGISTVG